MSILECVLVGPMTKGIRTLARVIQWRVDECRRNLGVLMKELENLEANRNALDSELVREQQVALDDPNEAGVLYGNYVEHAVNRRDIIDENIRAKEEEVEIAAEELKVNYRELKKYEVVRDRRLQREQAEEAQRDQIELDEIGIETYRRLDH
ncbi:MAG: hypothetical protein CMF69_03755 [Magnetovibrio sp.]|nr:hypothetical protein [Magnetovibrio sp.]